MFCTTRLGWPGMKRTRCLATTRAVVSTPPPGAKPTITVRVLPWYTSAAGAAFEAAGEIGETVMQELGRLARSQSRPLAILEVDGRVLLQRLARAFAGALEHQIDAMAADLVARARVELDQARLRAPLGPHPEELFRNALRPFDRRPVVIRRVHHDRRVVAAFRIDHFAAMHVLPDRLVGVHIALAGNVVVAAEDAVLELAEFLQLLHAGLDLPRKQIAAAARAAELQDRGHDRRRVDLRAVIHAFRIVAEHAGLERAVLAIVRVAFDHEAILIEIVAVPRSGIIGAELAERKLE